MSTNRTPAIIVVALIHLALGYALVTGLAYNVAKKAMEDLKTFDVTEEPPPPEEQPPPPKQDTPPPPQIVAPPPLVRTNQTAPPIISTPVAPPPQITPIARPAPPAPPAPPPPRIEPARAKANLASYVTNDDYPSDALNREEQGTTGFSLEVGPDGRVSNCSITSSSGSRSLDATTCRLMKSRARFTPATNSSGAKVADTVPGRIRWVIPAN